MKKSVIGVIILLMITGYSKSFAQDNPLEPAAKSTPIYIGPVFGYNRAQHAADFKVLPDEFNDQDVNCPSFSDGNNNGYFVGLSGEYFIGGNVNSNSSIIAKIVYSTMPAFFTDDGDGDEVPTLVEGKVEPVLTGVKYTNDLTYSVISTEIIYKFNFAAGLGITVGPAFDYALAITNENNMKITGKENNIIFVGYTKDDPKYSDGGRTRILATGDVKNANKFRLGMKIGFQYEKNLSGMIIVPNVVYNFGITDLTSDKQWRVSAFQIGVDIRFALK